MTTKEKIRFMARKYGYDAQSRQCIEEMAELTQAINKYWRKALQCGQLSLANVPYGNRYEMHVAEEIADVYIMLEQMAYLLHCEKDVDQYIKEKVDRQMRRIECENAETEIEDLGKMRI